MKFIIVRTDPLPRMYVAEPGSAHSYTNSLRNARRFDSRAEAEADRCPENEVVLDFDREADRVVGRR